MSNINSVADVILRQNNGQPIVLSSTTPIHSSFQLGTSAAQCALPNPLAAIDSADKFPNRNVGALPFILRAAGYVISGAKFQIDINLGTGLTQTIATTGLYTNGNANDNWLLEVEAMWDPTSLFLRGLYYGWAGNSAVAQAALASVQSPANLAALTFNCAVTVPSANANFAAYLTEFSAELV